MINYLKNNKIDYLLIYKLININMDIKKNGTKGLVIFSLKKDVLQGIDLNKLITKNK